jgi:hypothetical protein
MSPWRVMIVLPLLAGCTGTVVQGEQTDADTSALTGVVVVEETAFAGDVPRAEVSARFVKVHGAIDDGALRLAGTQLTLPALGECTTLVDEPLRAPTVSVELLNVGALNVESAAGKATLQPRRVPDVTDLVSGVLYTARTDGLRGTVRVRAAGADPEIGPLVAEAQAPAELRGLKVAGVEGKGPEPIGVAAGAIDVDWEAGNRTDVVYVDVLAQGTPTTRCAVADVGHLTVPAPSSQTGTIAVHRLHREPLAAMGRGELRFDWARLVPFTIRPK